VKGAYTALAVLAFAIAAQILFFAAQLPEHVASHFDASGRPDGWSSRGAILGMYIGLCLFLALTFWGCIVLVGRVPSTMLNVPNREYWLSGERRAETIRYLQRQLAWFAVGTVLFLAAVMQMVMQANITGGGHLPTAEFWLLLIGYLVLTFGWVFRLIARFRATRTS
jgi:uncharacterized membrane protein